MKSQPFFSIFTQRVVVCKQESPDDCEVYLIGMDGFELGARLAASESLEVYEAWSSDLKKDVIIKTYTTNQVQLCENYVRAAFDLLKSSDFPLRDLIITWADRVRGVCKVNFVFEKMSRRPDASFLERNEGADPKPRATYQKGKVLGSNFATMMEVYEARSGDTIVVVKSYHCMDLTETNGSIREALLQAAVASEFNCQLIDFAFEASAGARDVKALIVMEQMVGDLRRDLEAHKESGRRYTEQELRTILAHISSALAHAKSLGIAHRDMKPENVLISPRGCFKVADFGASWLKGRITKARTAVGTSRYFSPEVRLAFVERGVLYDPFRSDSYSLGVMMLELANLSYNEDLETGKQEAITRVVGEELKKMRCSPQLNLLIASMLHFDPFRRLPLENIKAEAEALLHEFIAPESAVLQATNPSSPALIMKDQLLRFDYQTCTWRTPVRLARPIQVDRYTVYTLIEATCLRCCGGGYPSKR